METTISPHTRKRNVPDQHEPTIDWFLQIEDTQSALETAASGSISLSHIDLSIFFCCLYRSRSRRRSSLLSLGFHLTSRRQSLCQWQSGRVALLGLTLPFHCVPVVFDYDVDTILRFGMKMNTVRYGRFAAARQHGYEGRQSATMADFYRPIGAFGGGCPGGRVTSVGFGRNNDGGAMLLLMSHSSGRCRPKGRWRSSSLGQQGV